MKHTLHILAFFLLSITICRAQVNLVIEKGEMVLSKDTVRIGDSLLVKYIIKNTGNNTYNGPIAISMRTNLEKTPITRQEPRIIEPGQSVPVQAKFKMGFPYFQDGQKSIIVIWPTGTGTVIRGDTLRRTVTTIAGSSIKGQTNTHSRVRFYPNPARNIIYFKTEDPTLKVKSIRLRNIQGKSFVAEIRDFSTFSYLELDKYVNGLYILDIQFSDNTQMVYRIIKTE